MANSFLFLVIFHWIFFFFAFITSFSILAVRLILEKNSPRFLRGYHVCSIANASFISIMFIFTLGAWLSSCTENDFFMENSLDKLKKDMCRENYNINYVASIVLLVLFIFITALYVLGVQHIHRKAWAAGV